MSETSKVEIAELRRLMTTYPGEAVEPWQMALLTSRAVNALPWLLAGILCDYTLETRRRLESLERVASTVRNVEMQDAAGLPVAETKEKS